MFFGVGIEVRGPGEKRSASGSPEAALGGVEPALIGDRFVSGIVGKGKDGD